MLHAALRILGAHHAVLASVLIGLILSSIPLGAYVVLGAGGAGVEIPDVSGLPAGLDIRHVFAALWCAYAVMVGIALAGPRLGITGALAAAASGRAGLSWMYENHMLAVAGWFSVLILASAAIDTVQTTVGVAITPPDYGGDLLRLYDATKAPIIEEVGFRVLLIGVPLAGVYAFRNTPKNLARSLLCPHSVHGRRSLRIALALVVASAFVFGLLHVLGDGSWSPGKATQAAAAGVILGWVYYRHGLLAAILVHWAANYFILSFLQSVSVLAGTSVDAASSHAASLALEVVLVASGAVFAALLVAGRVRLLLDSKRVA